jgi:Zn-finger nucleic acid-binding protein
MIVACTACSTRFEAGGYRDPLCPTCGAIAQQANARPCPRCELPLAGREVSDVVIDECSGCNGLFLDEIAIKRVIDDRQHVRAGALLAALPRVEHQPMPPSGGRMYIKCPACSTVMNRKLFATGSGVVVDVCRNHGTFFDAGELPSIIEFVQKGGLAKAAKVDAARKAEQAKRDAANAARVRAMPESLRADWGDVDRGAALVDLLFSLFH